MCVVGAVFNCTFAPVMLHVVLMLLQEINKHSYGRLCCSPLTMAHNLFHDVGVETLYTDYSMGYTVRPMHILFRPCGLTLNKRNDRQRSPTAIMQTNSSMRMRVRINVVGVVLSINDCRKRVSGRGLCEPFTKTNFARRYESLRRAYHGPW